MVQGFLLDGIDMAGHGAAIDKAAQFSVDIHACPARPAFTIGDGASVGAKKTFDNRLFTGGSFALTGERFPVTGHGGQTHDLIKIRGSEGQPRIVA